MQRLIFALAALAALAVSGAARADVTLCNERDERHYEYAMIWDEGLPFIAEIWKAQGWRSLPPKACVTILKTNARQTVYLSVRHKYRAEGRAYISHFPAEDINRNDWVNSGWHVIESFFCVQEGDFFRTENSVESHRTCPPNYHMQLFNLMGFAAVNTNLTLRLSRRAE